MTTVASRTFRSSPYRDTTQTWTAIVELLTQGRASQARNELYAVSGVAASIIAEQAPKSAPILVTCDGPRTRIYCVYDDDAIDDSEENEGPLGFNPLQGDWHVSLPCPEDDLSWVQAALEKNSSRITARDLELGLSEGEKSKPSSIEPLVLDARRFLKP